MAPSSQVPPPIQTDLPLPKAGLDASAPPTSPGASTTSPDEVRPTTQATMASNDAVPALIPGLQVLLDYIRRVSELDSLPFTPMFLPAEGVLTVHKRAMVAVTSSEHRYIPGIHCYSCRLTTSQVGRSWLLEATATPVPVWVLFKDTPTGEETLPAPTVRTMMLEKRDDHVGPDPVWEDLKEVLLRESLSKEGACYVDSLTGAVEGLHD